MPSYVRREDANQEELADVLRQLGWCVWEMHQVAAYVAGWPDLVCLRRGRWMMVEVKRVGQEQELRPSQCAMRALVEWHGGEYYVVSSPDDVMLISEVQNDEFERDRRKRL